MYNEHDCMRQRKLNPQNGKDRISAKNEPLENFPLLYGTMWLSTWDEVCTITKTTNH